MILKYLLALKLRVVFRVPEDFAVGDLLWAMQASHLFNRFCCECLVEI
jgi:hypothetical protein